jgi:uncharacterized protein
MDIVLLILGGICLLGGLAGAILPLPGPGLSFFGLLLIHFSHYADFSTYVLTIFGVMTVAIAILDYFIPIWGMKRFGGTRNGTIGAIVGGLVGIFIIPGIGLFPGTFLGAFAGELLGGMATKKALKSAFGSFLGFITGVFIQVALCIAMLIYAGYGIYDQI